MMKIHENISLRKRNTFDVDVKCRYFVRPESVSDIVDLIHSEVFRKYPAMILGDGSNVLFLKDYVGIIIQPAVKHWEIVEETVDEVLIKVGSGINWAESFVPSILTAGYWGGENLSFIPGTVGAAAFQNIGAYGVEAKDIIEKVEGVNLLNSRVQQYTNNECEFSYRNSIFKRELQDRFLITYVYFRLFKLPRPVLTYGRLKDYFTANRADLLKVSEFIVSERERKLPDPKNLGNAGSFFKNPIINHKLIRKISNKYKEVPVFPIDENFSKISAGWLIEQCGWKGKREGNVGVYPLHALVLVNYGAATGKDIYLFSEKIKKSVLDQFGIELEMEIRVV